MKPFNLEAAKAGAKLCTRSGNPARIVDFDYEATEQRIIGARIMGPSGFWYFRAYHADGSFLGPLDPTNCDLMMIDTEEGRNNSDDFLDNNLMNRRQVAKCEPDIIGIKDEIIPALKSKRISEW